MDKSQPLTNVRIRVVFAEEIAALRGTIANVIHQDDRLYLRAVLPRYAEVGSLDSVQCGVALRSVEGALQVHPYVFRLVCENGAIMAHALQTRRIENLAARASDSAETLLREAIVACGSQEAFETSAGEMQRARSVEANRWLEMMSFLTQFPETTQNRLMGQIMEHFGVERDTTRFGLMNAITATARDTDDPELRWQLEEFGGGVPALPGPSPTRAGAAALSPPLLKSRNWEQADIALPSRELHAQEAVLV